MTAAIRTEGLSKQYRLGERETYGALRDSIARAFRSPGRLFRRARRDERQTIWALRDVSFDIQAGDILGIVGRNGSGKSTLLKLLSRITEPTRGRAIVAGRIGALLEVGTGFHPELTGRENVFVNGAILGMRRAEIARKFDEIVAFADVAQFIDTPVKFYSSGMQMRLAFAVAAHLEPDILLVDEVLAVGDAAFQRKCLGKLDDVSRDGRTIIFVSHQMNQLRRLCTKCLWLDGGRLVDAGATTDITNRYEASFMAAGAGQFGVGDGETAAFLGWTLGAKASDEHTLSTFGPVSVHFTLRLTTPIRNGHHGVVLYDVDGGVVWGTGLDNLELAAGEYEICYSLPSLPLRPGPYRWLVTLYDGGQLVARLDCVPEMSVETPPLGHRQDEFAGRLNFPYEVDFVREPHLEEIAGR